MAAVHAKQTITWTRGRLTWWTFITVDFEQRGGAFVADLERVLGLVVGRHVVDRQFVHRSAHGRIVLLVHLGNDLQLVLQPTSHSVNRRIHPSIHQSIDRSVGRSVSQSISQSRLCANTTSSTKLEVHNVSLRRQSRTEPRPEVTCAKNPVKIGRVVPEI